MLYNTYSTKYYLRDSNIYEYKNNLNVRNEMPTVNLDNDRFFGFFRAVKKKKK